MPSKTKQTDSRHRMVKKQAKSWGISSDSVDQLHEALASLPSQELVRTWFSDTKWQTKEQNYAHIVLRMYLVRKQSDLFRWVYGEGSVHAKDAVHVRLPSHEKRQLVELMLSDSRNRYPWLTSKLIHGMAFAPSGFDRLKPTATDSNAWGRLYRRVSIPRGTGRRQRHLWIPNPPLKQVQKSLLRILGAGLARKLGPYVYGIKEHESAPVFRNAAAHCHSKIIINFDLRDFFPSTTVAHILNGFRFCRERNAMMVSEQFLPQKMQQGSQKRSLSWSRDAEVLIARLGTRRGRLPQGSPLSPLLANLAFAAYDAEMVRQLSEAFGEHHFRYSRYFDDITISFLNSPARPQVAKRMQEIKQECQQMLENVLLNSGYHLNDRKTSCSETKHGHKVTGLIVRPESVSLPRRQSRELRVIVHSLEKHGFVETAKRWYALNHHVEPQPSEKNLLRSGHRWVAGSLQRRRISAEKLSTMMLRHVGIEFRATLVLTNWFPWQERYSGGKTSVSGNDVFYIVERLLSLLWAGHISVRADDENTKLVFSQQTTVVCELQAEHALGFFQLSKKDAFAVTEFWHFLNGKVNYLGSCPKDPLFSKILVWHERLAAACGTLRLPLSLGQAAPAAKTQPAPETTESELLKRLRQFREHYEDFRKSVSKQADGDVVKSLEAFVSTVVSSVQEFQSWAALGEAFLVQYFAFLPNSRRQIRNLNTVQFYDYLSKRGLAERGLVHGKYKVVSKFEQQLESETPEQLQLIQCSIVHYLITLFKTAGRTRQQVEYDEWVAGLIDNQSNLVPVKERVLRLVETVTESFARLSERDNEPSFFLPQTITNLLSMEARECLQQCDFECPSTSAWDSLFKKAHAIYINLCDSINPKVIGSLRGNMKKQWDEKVKAAEEADESLPDARRFLFTAYKKLLDREAGDVNSSNLTLLAQLRHRHAHGIDSARIKEWVEAQRLVRNILGREWAPPKGTKGEHQMPDQAGDLEISGYEAALVWIEILETVQAFLDLVEDDMK